MGGGHMNSAAIETRLDHAHGVRIDHVWSRACRYSQHFITGLITSHLYHNSGTWTVGETLEQYQ